MAALRGMDSVMRNLRQLAELRVRAAVRAVALRYAAEGEGYMKANAPWQDRTGVARQSLWGAVEEGPSYIKVGYGHGVEYGIYLELRSGKGRRPILEPTRDRMAPLFFEDVKRLVQ